MLEIVSHQIESHQVLAALQLGGALQKYFVFVFLIY